LRARAQRSDIPLLVDFWAPWRGPCKMVAPQFQQVARQAGAMGAQDTVRRVAAHAGR